jgi:hypothetical protein
MLSPPTAARRVSADVQPELKWFGSNNDEAIWSWHLASFSRQHVTINHLLVPLGSEASLFILLGLSPFSVVRY